MIKFLADHFKKNGWVWSLKGRGKVVPTEEDLQKALDEAQRILYSSTDGNMLQIGRLIVIKQDTGLDVYVLAGTIGADAPNPIGE